MLKAIAKLVAALNGNTKRSQIALGFSWGVLLALLPAGSLFWIAIFVLSFFLRHHHGGKMLVMALGKCFTPLLYPFAIDPLGWDILHIEALRDFYTTLYNTPFVLFTRFNNTLVAGGLAAGAVLFFPVFFLVFFLVPVYRKTLLPKIMNAKLIKALSQVPLIARFAGMAAGFGAGGE